MGNRSSRYRASSHVEERHPAPSAPLDEPRQRLYTAPAPSSPPSSAVAIRAGADVLCNICCRNCSETVIPVSKVTSECPCNRTICTICLQRHILEAVAKQDYDIRCICTSSNCTSRLTYGHIKAYADETTFHHFDEGLLRRTLEKDPEFCWCSRPGCGSGQLHGSRDRYPIMRCHECNSKTCFTHRCPWHEGCTCKQYDKDAANSDEVALLQLMENSKYSRCPQCNHGIERNHGCDHMTCRCKHEFCWRCLAPYGGCDGIRKKGNSAHKRTCRHYRKK